jgi:TolB-like protein/Tfp pilus assembly protein PilF
MDLASSILRDKAPDLAGVPADFARIVDRCLQKNPRERYQTAIDVGNELRRVGRGAPAAKATAPGNTASIAVLPFVNRSADPEDEYFADGLADELLTMLARIRGLQVAARTSSSQFKGTKEDLETIGRKLKVASLIEGSVRKAGNRVRITVQLVTVADGYRIWSESYDRTLDDVFAVQDDIAQAVVKELRRTLLGEADDSDASRDVRAEVAHAARGRSTNPEAQRLLLLGRHLNERRTPESIERAIEYLQQALALDPEFAPAWAELASVHSRKSAFGAGLEERRSEAARAHVALDRALALAPDMAEAHAMLGWINLTIDLDWKGAQSALQRALELEPTEPFTMRLAGIVARTGGDFPRSETLLRQAVERDPLAGTALHNLGMVLQLLGRHAEAIETFDNALVLMANTPVWRAIRAISLGAVGRLDEALAEAAREPDPVFRLWALGVVCAGAGRTAEADRHLAELVEDYAVDGAYQIATLYARRGDADEAFRWLERARVELDGGIMEARAAPEFRFMHDDPRWAALMRALNFQ